MLFLPFLLFCSALAAPFTPDQDLTPSNRTNVFSDATTTGFEVHSILPRGTVLDVHPRAVEGSGPEKAGAVKAVANSKKTGTAKASTKATTKPNTKPDTKAKTKPDTKAKNKANTGKTSETSASNVHKASNTVSHSAAGKPVPVIVFPKPRADCGKFTKDVKDGKIKMNAVDIPPSIKGASSKVHQAVFWSGEMSEDEIRMYNQPVYGVSVQTDAMPEKPAEDLDTKTTAAHTSDNILKKPVKDSSAKTDAATEKSGGTGDVKSDRSGPRGRSLSDLQNRSDPVRQIDAPWELAMLSQLPGKPSRNYYYDKTAGAGVQIYYIDSGLNSQHDTVLKWRRLPEKPTLAFLAPSNHKGGTDQDSDGHGTCVWSKLVGWLGVAKAADVSVVASPYEFKSTMLRALNTVLWDAYRKYKARGVIKTAILSISVDMTDAIGFPPTLEAVFALERMFDVLGDYQVMIFFAAENSSRRAKNNYLDLHIDPVQCWGQRFDNFASVGAVDAHGDYASRRDPPGKRCINFYAPGVQVTCVPATGKRRGFVRESGTSFATPITAGLAAYYLGLEGNSYKKPADIKRWLRTHAKKRSRRRDAPLVVANEHSN